MNISTIEINIDITEKINKLRGKSQPGLLFIKKLIRDIVIKAAVRNATSVIDIGLLIVFSFFIYFYFNIKTELLFMILF